MLLLGAFALICSVGVFIAGIFMTSAGLAGRGVGLIILGVGIGLCALAIVLAQVIESSLSLPLFYIGIFLSIISLVILALTTLFGRVDRNTR